MVKAFDVTVIVPVFNAEESLEFSLKSLINQTLKTIEIIVINDASTDKSSAIIHRFAKENDNIISIDFAENQGVHEARLAGIKVASSPWIGFLDADDFARPTMFDTMFQTAKQHGADIVVCGSYRVNTDRQPLAPKLSFKKSEKVTSNIFERFCHFNFGTGMLWNKLYHRDIITPYSDMHFPWRQNINEDLILNIGCFSIAKSVYLINEILHEYVFHESSTTSKTKNAKSYVDTYRAYALAVSIFSLEGEVIIYHIINMYRIQLSWGAYQIDDINELSGYIESLNEATSLINTSYPPALALLSIRHQPSKVGVKLAIKYVFHSILSKLSSKVALFR